MREVVSSEVATASESTVPDQAFWELALRLFGMQRCAIAGWLLDRRSGHVTWWLDPLAALGFPASELTSWPELLARICAEDRGLLESHLASAGPALEGPALEISTVRNGGARRRIAVLSRALNAETTLALAMDVTASSQIESALVLAERRAEAGRAVAVVAHEINNVLEALGNYLYLARTAPADPERFLQSAEREVQQLAQLTRSTLDSVRQSGAPALVDLHDVTQELALILGAVAKSREIAMTLRVPAGSFVLGDAGELKQVFGNLIRNALDATAPGGRVMVRAHGWSSGRKAEASGCRVTVADDGRGIAPEHRDKIFESFFTTKGPEGNGLGLWVVAEIVRSHRGSIRVKTRSALERTGTVFMLFFPPPAASQQHD
jgi:signal transduction histidine kinase